MRPENCIPSFPELSSGQSALPSWKAWLAIGFGKLMRPVKTSCADHMGSSWARIITWNGEKYETTSDWYEADMSVIDPLVKAGADKYAKEKGLTPRDCSKE